MRRTLITFKTVPVQCVHFTSAAYVHLLICISNLCLFKFIGIALQQEHNVILYFIFF